MFRKFSPRVKRYLSEGLVDIATRPPVKNLLLARSIGTEGLRSEANSRGTLLEYGSSGSATFDQPLHNGSLEPEIQEKIGQFEVEQPYVVELENVELIGPHPIAVDSEGRYILEQSLRSLPLLLRGIVASVSRGVNPNRQTERRETTDVDALVPLVGIWNRGFFHWFSEWLPRLEGVRVYAEASGLYPTLLLPTDPPPWMVDSLRLLGYADHDWIEWTGGRLHVNKLVMPSLRRAHGVSSGTSGYVVPPDAYRWVREELLSKVKVSDSDPSRRILITRSDAEERRLRNVTELIDVVGDLEPHVLSDLSLEEQIRLFSCAEVVIGPHGAGFTNLIYANEPVVIEAFGDFVNACYFTLSEGLGYVYGYLTGTSIEPDISIDPDGVRLLLEAADGSTTSGDPE